MFVFENKNRPVFSSCKPEQFQGSLAHLAKEAVSDMESKVRQESDLSTLQSCKTVLGLGAAASWTTGIVLHVGDCSGVCELCIVSQQG